MAYAPSSPVVHAPLPPPVGYAPPPEASYGESAPAQFETPPPTDPARLVWRPSPRWATVKRGSTVAVKRDPEAKFKAAQAKAEKLGVHTLTQQDIEGLSPAQITQIRGY
jgi:hypothetical protein